MIYSHDIYRNTGGNMPLSALYITVADDDDNNDNVYDSYSGRQTDAKPRNTFVSKTIGDVECKRGCFYV